jgi:uncharacterized repeat protein (TIGR03803 family)
MRLFIRQYIAIAGILAAAGCNGTSQVAPPIAGQQRASAPRADATQQSRAATASFTSLYSFAGGTDGANPAAGLTALNGALYGTTEHGGTTGGYGTVFAITPSAQEQVLYRFGGPPNDGAFPSAELVSLRYALYGTTRGGGSGSCLFSKLAGCGTVFSIGGSGQEEYLYSFKGGTIDGEFPYAGVTARNGALFGTTQGGGTFGRGMFYAITVYGAEGDEYNFRGAGYGDGAVPMASVFEYAYGEFAGTTQQGGTGQKHCGTFYGCGTVFAISAAGREGILYSFKGGRDAWGPIGSVILVNGRLYGAAQFGGAYRNGAVFSLTTAGHEKVQ